MRLKIAARKSDLARLQARLVGARLESAHPGLVAEYLFKESLGDINLTDPLWKAPEKGVFTEDFYRDLVEGHCDVVVHSWKDLPIVDKPDTLIAGTLERADSRDLLLIKKQSRGEQPQRLRILSSSPRRNYNLSPFLQWSLPWPVREVVMEPVRGNIPTRLRKLIEGEAHGLIVAKAALDRLMVSPEAEFQPVQELLREFLQRLDFQVIPHSVNPPCAGQGALAIEARRHDSAVRALLETITCSTTFREIEAERQILKSYGGGCHQKIGVWRAERTYGTIEILRGLTESGQVLERQTIHQQRPPPRRPVDQMISWAGERETTRTPLHVPPPSSAGWIVARSEALPSEWATSDRFLWAAGLTTWRQLSARGTWVHGSFEGLGESPIELPFLGRPLSWTKLSHHAADSDTHPMVATYEWKWSSSTPQKIQPNAFYFWRSLRQFEAIRAQSPEILQAYHACGPGNTYRGLQKHIERDRLWAFFNEEDWRQQCQA